MLARYSRRAWGFRSVTYVKVPILAVAAGGCLAVVLAGPVRAADIPLKATPAATVVNSWEGAYVGGHVGYSFDVTKLDAGTGLFNTDFLSGRGVTGGLLAG